MSERQETIADIVDDMRIFKCRNLETGEVKLCSAIANYLADRIEAAKKREVGNGTKMRKALIKAATMLSVCEWPDGTDMEGVKKLRRNIGAALAKPPRACDVLSANELKLQVFAGLAYQIKIKGLDIRGLELLLKSVAGAVIDIAYDTNEEGTTND